MNFIKVIIQISDRLVIPVFIIAICSLIFEDELANLTYIYILRIIFFVLAVIITLSLIIKLLKRK